MAHGNGTVPAAMYFDLFNDGVERPLKFGDSFLEDSEDEYDNPEYYSITCEYNNVGHNYGSK